MEDIKLTAYTRFSGCGAKLGPEMLDKALCGLSQPDYPELIADYRTSEDSGIYRISETTALIQTVDFFPPIVDDPYLFGRIAAANSLSDIYACGGKPVTAVSIVCFPKDTMEIEHLRAITAGGLDALAEAGTALVGGHSVDDQELKFGFSVTGLAEINEILLNNTPRAGDLLFLTKPLGTGTINTALRAEMARPESIRAAAESMGRLNRKASECLKKLPVTACTDVTGFGLAGHLAEMIQDTAAGAAIDYGKLPLLPHVMEYIETGLVPEGTYRNRKFRAGMICNTSALDQEILDMVFDPQTSGGLLFSLPPEYRQEAESLFADNGTDLHCIGEINDKASLIEIRL